MAEPGKPVPSYAPLVAALVVGALAVVALWGALKVPLGGLRAPEAGFVPLVEAILLVLAAVGLAVAAVRRPSQPAIAWPTGDARQMVVLLALALVGYVIALPILGFAAATFAFLWAAIVLWRKYSWWRAGLYAAVIALVLHLVFKVALRMTLPGGWWQ